jgi:hypothetical protein
MNTRRKLNLKPYDDRTRNGTPKTCKTFPSIWSTFNYKHAAEGDISTSAKIKSPEIYEFLLADNTNDKFAVAIKY